MLTTLDTTAAAVGDILRFQVDKLFRSLHELFGAEDEGQGEELTDHQEEELMLFVISMIRLVASGCKHMAPYAKELYELGILNLIDRSMNLDEHSLDNFRRKIDKKVISYLHACVVSAPSETLNLASALVLLSSNAKASNDLNRRLTSVGAQRYLEKQLSIFHQYLFKIESEAMELHNDAVTWLSRRQASPDGAHRSIGSFGIPEIGLNISPKVPKWSTASLDEPLCWVVSRIEDDFERDVNSQVSIDKSK